MLGGVVICRALGEVGDGLCLRIRNEEGNVADLVDVAQAGEHVLDREVGVGGVGGVPLVRRLGEEPLFRLGALAGAPLCVDGVAHGVELFVEGADLLDRFVAVGGGYDAVLVRDPCFVGGRRVDRGGHRVDGVGADLLEAGRLGVDVGRASVQVAKRAVERHADRDEREAGEGELANELAVVALGLVRGVVCALGVCGCVHIESFVQARAALGLGVDSLSLT